MPFTKESAKAAGKSGGAASAKARWGNKDPATVRNKQLKVVISESEYNMIEDKATAAEMSKAELIVRAVRCYKK